MSSEVRFPRPLVSVAELAGALGVTVFNIHYHIRQGHIPTERLGKQHVIEREVAERIVANYQRNQTWSTES